MARNREKDNLMFNCSQQHEHDYVAGLYDATQRPSVRTLLTNGCANIISANIIPNAILLFRLIFPEYLSSRYIAIMSNAIPKDKAINHPIMIKYHLDKKASKIQPLSFEYK